MLLVLFSMCMKNKVPYRDLGIDTQKGVEEVIEDSQTASEVIFVHVAFFLISLFTTVLIGLMLMQYDNLHDSLKYEGGLEKTCSNHTDTDIGLERTPWFVVTCFAIGFYGLTALSLVPTVWTGYCMKDSRLV